MNIEFSSNEPIYIQIIKYFKQQIVLGRLKPGDEIPSRRELAAMLKVNANTVQRAYKEMEDQGIIVTVRNFHSTVTSKAESISAIKQQLIEEALDSFLKALEPIGVSKEEVKKLLDERWCGK